MTERGEKHPCWKGGKITDGNGYILIWKPDHPFATQRGYVFEHRLIYEEYYNCCLLPFVIIHHINGIIDDNRIENLQPMYRGLHSLIHNVGNKNAKKDIADRICLLCNSKVTYIDKYGCNIWGKYKDGFICNKCRIKVWKKSIIL